MERVPEPELMLDEQQARAYAAADFEEPHSRFIALLRTKLVELPASGAALDLGCGPGDITLRFARAFPDWRVDALDASPPMLELGRHAARREGLESRVRFVEAHLPSGQAPGKSYDLVFSNSLLHHLAEPSALWSCLRSWVASPGWTFVMDLSRPGSRDEASALVDRYAAGEPEVLRSDFFHSLLAAYRPAEVREQLAASGLGHLTLELVSDRHLVVWGRVA